MSTFPPCVTLEDGCVICSEVEPSPAIPPSVQPLIVAGWGQGANSIAQLGGDVHTTFYINTPNSAIVIGFKSVRDTIYDPTLIEHGLSFAYAGGVPVFYVIEHGVQKTSPVPYAGSTVATAGDSFTIGRVGVTITYYRNNIPLYTSTVPSIGALVVNACPYASGDEVI